MPSQTPRARPPAAPSSTGVGRERIAGLALALFLISGSWSISRIAGVEPSPIWEPRTWSVMLLVALALLPSNQRLRTTRSAIVPELAWLCFSALAITWAPDIELARAQVFDIALLVAAGLALQRLTVVGHAEALAEALRWGLLVLLLGLMAAALAGGLGSGRLAVLGGGPNVFGRNMGLLAVLGLERAMFTRARPTVTRHTQPDTRTLDARGPERSSARTTGLHHAQRPTPRTPQRILPWLVIACIAAGLVALSGSRGAMISTFATVSMLLVLGRARLGRRLAVLLGVLGLFIALLLFTPLGAQVIESFSSRVLDLLVGERYVSSRDRIYVIALQGGAESPIIGNGLASFPATTAWPYAHNIMLDAWYETGAIGVALLLMYLAHVAREAIRFGSEGRELWLGLTVLIFTAAQFSGGRYDSRGLMVFAAVMLSLPQAKRAITRVKGRS